MNDLIEIVNDLEALDANAETLQELIIKWNARIDTAEAELSEIYLEMDDGA